MSFSGLFCVAFFSFKKFIVLKILGLVLPNIACSKAKKGFEFVCGFVGELWEKISRRESEIYQDKEYGLRTDDAFWRARVKPTN